MRASRRDGSSRKGGGAARQSGPSVLRSVLLVSLLTVIALVLIAGSSSAEITVNGTDSAWSGDFVTLRYYGLDDDVILTDVVQNDENSVTTWDLASKWTVSKDYDSYYAINPLIEVNRNGNVTAVRLFMFETGGNDVIVNVTGLSDGNVSSFEHTISVPELSEPLMIITNETSRDAEYFEPGETALAYIVGLEGNGTFSISGGGYNYSRAVAFATPTVIEFEVPDITGRYTISVGLDPPHGNGSVVLTDSIMVYDPAVPSDSEDKGVADEAGIGALFLFVFLIFGGALLAMLAYSRLRKSPFTNDNRRRVYEYIQAFPGSHFRGISRDLEMKNNSLAHHLRVLMESNEIKERRDGVYKRFYAYDYVIDPRDIFLSRTKVNIVEAIGRNPGATVKELAESVAMPVQTVSSNLGHLYEEGVVRLERDGKYKRCYLVE